MRKRTATFAVCALLLLPASPAFAEAPQGETAAPDMQQETAGGNVSEPDTPAETQGEQGAVLETVLPETAAGDADAGWEETYTYLAGSGDRHIYPEQIIKNGVLYEMADTQYEIVPLTKAYTLTSPDMWKGKEYTAPSELDADGLHYTLTDTVPEEWQATGRTRSVYTERTYLEGQEIPETLDTEAQDTVTGETLAVTIPRTAVNADGAGWQEGGLSTTVTYDWDNEAETWFLSVGGEKFAAESDENPAFEGYEAKVLAYARLDGTYYQVTGLAWSGDGYQDESGAWKREASVTGNKMLPRNRAVFSGDVPQPDLPMVRYTSHYVSDVTGYLITAHVSYRIPGPGTAAPTTEPETQAQTNTDNVPEETQAEQDRAQKTRWQEATMIVLESVCILLVILSIACICRIRMRRQRAWKK